MIKIIKGSILFLKTSIELDGILHEVGETVEVLDYSMPDYVTCKFSGNNSDKTYVLCKELLTKHKWLLSLKHFFYLP